MVYKGSKVPFVTHSSRVPYTKAIPVQKLCYDDDGPVNRDQLNNVLAWQRNVLATIHPSDETMARNIPRYTQIIRDLERELSIGKG